MTTVAKTIDAPILLQFPQDLLRHGWLDASKYGMLGESFRLVLFTNLLIFRIGRYRCAGKNV